MIQIKDQNERVVSLSWISGNIAGNQNLDLSQSWLPKNSGNYNVETFVWTSFSEQIPLSNSTSTPLVIE